MAYKAVNLRKIEEAFTEPENLKRGQRPDLQGPNAPRARNAGVIDCDNAAQKYGGVVFKGNKVHFPKKPPPRPAGVIDCDKAAEKYGGVVFKDNKVHFP